MLDHCYLAGDNTKGKKKKGIGEGRAEDEGGTQGKDQCAGMARPGRESCGEEEGERGEEKTDGPSARNEGLERFRRLKITNGDKQRKSLPARF